MAPEADGGGMSRCAPLPPSSSVRVCAPTCVRVGLIPFAVLQLVWDLSAPVASAVRRPPGSRLVSKRGILDILSMWEKISLLGLWSFLLGKSFHYFWGTIDNKVEICNSCVSSSSLQVANGTDGLLLNTNNLVVLGSGSELVSYFISHTISCFFLCNS